jgi:hypothetical protein
VSHTDAKKGWRRVPLAIALLLSAAAPASSTAWRLTIDGYGPVRIGMTRPQVASALHATLTLVGGEDDGERCAVASSSEQPGVEFHFEQSRLASISISRPSKIRTPRDIGIGSRSAAVHRAYGKALKSHPKYDYGNGPEEDIVYWVDKAERGVRFIIGKDRRIHAILAGDETIFLVDGCE